MFQRLVFLLIALLIQTSFPFEISSDLKEGKACILNKNGDAGLHYETCLANNNLRPRSSRTYPINPMSKRLPFNKYSWLTTHNSFAPLGEVSKTGSVILAPPDQQDSITSQLTSFNVKSPKGLAKVFNTERLQKFMFPVTRMTKNGGDWPTLDDMIRQTA